MSWPALDYHAGGPARYVDHYAPEMQHRNVIITASVACALSAATLAGCAPPTDVSSEPVASAAPTIQVTTNPEPPISNLDAEDAAAYDSATASFDLSLPHGYSWTSGADRGTTSDAGTQVWYDWIAANADAALAGDAEAARALVSAQGLVPFGGGFQEDVVGLIESSNYAVLLTMFPLPDGMRTG